MSSKEGGDLLLEDELQALHQSIEQLNSANRSSSFQQQHNIEAGSHKNNSNKKKRSRESPDALVDVQTQTPRKRNKRKITVPSELLESDNPIDEILEGIAQRKNLTTNNVRHLLRNIISHESVQELLKCSLDSNMRLPFEPKLTRSKTKEWLETQNLPYPPSAKKSNGNTCILMDEVFPDDSSDDDEYK